MKTGDYGRDGEPFYSDDPDALGRVYTGPYMKLEPDFALTLERVAGGDSAAAAATTAPRYCGYSFGTPDTRRFFGRYDSEWRPELTRLFADPPEATRATWTRAQHMHHAYHHPTFALPPEVDLARFPAHLHIDLLEEARGAGIGRVMLEEVMRRLRAAGACGVHLCMAATNDAALAFYRKLGFEVLVRSGDDLYMGKGL
jgi:GNAT superfamily N-acetyltransferase